MTPGQRAGLAVEFELLIRLHARALRSWAWALTQTCTWEMKNHRKREWDMVQLEVHLPDGCNGLADLQVRWQAQSCSELLPER